MHVLEQPLVLNLILQYAGPNQWLFLGGVSKAWAALYNSVVHKRPARRQRGVPLAYTSDKATGLAEAAASITRALYACSCDPQLIPKKLLPLCKGAAFCGSIDVLSLLKALAGNDWLPLHQDLCMAAAARNQLTTLQSLHTSCPQQQWKVAKIAAKAAECADLSMLQWILEQQPDRSTKSMHTMESVQSVSGGAARAADAIDKIEWLYQRFSAYRCSLSYYFAVESIKGGAVESLRWLASSGHPFVQSEYTDYASSAGQLDTLRFLVEEAGCSWDAYRVRGAAVYADSAEILQWASSTDSAAWDTAVLSRLLQTAGQEGKLRAAVWLRAAGAEWPVGFFYNELGAGGLGVWQARTMRWARANGCPWGFWSRKLCTEICSERGKGTWLSCTWHSVQDAMLWAHAAGCPCDIWQHRIAGRLVRKQSRGSSDVDSDVGADVATDSYWNAVLFTLLFTDDTAFKVAVAVVLSLVVALIVAVVAAALHVLR
jgi:hypothetical protein